MNPKDIMTDAIHNFHPQYQQYTQYSSGKSNLSLVVFFVFLKFLFKCMCDCCLRSVAIVNLIFSLLSFKHIVMILNFVFLSVSYLLQK